MLGTFSLIWDEAVKIGGADPDFHRRDLFNAIAMKDYPETGFQSYPAEESGKKMRLRPESFADHYSQARLFFR